MSLIEIPKARFHPCMDSFLGALHGVLTALNDPHDIEDLWGISALGFRIQVHRTLEPVGLFPRQWDETYPRILRRFGYDCICGLRNEFYTPNDLRELQFAWMNTVTKALDDGRPGICFGIHGPAFGIIYGIDDDTEDYRVSTCFETQKGNSANAQDVGSLNPPLIFMLIPTGPVADFDPRASVRAALREAVYHHLGQEAAADGKHVVVPHDLVDGPAAYNSWSTALETAQVRPHWGPAYYAGYFTESRSAASVFLKNLARTDDWRYCAELLDLAAAHLANEAESLRMLARIFPVNEPEAIRDSMRRTEASAVLRAARAEHIAAMENLIEVVNLENEPPVSADDRQ